jgi:hypothetical protein
MVDFKKYHERIEKRIGEAMAADKILEGPWWDVVIKDLNLMSYYFARELELQLKTPIEKNYLVDNTVAYNLPYEEWPPMRLMALALIVGHWLGWISTTHGPPNGLGWIQEAYNAGLSGFLQGPEIRDWVQTLQGEQWLQTPKGKEWQKQQQQQKETASKPTENTSEGTQKQSNVKTEGSS